MSTHKLFDFICVVVLLLTIAITVLFINGERLGIEVIVDEDAEGYSGSAYFTQNDLAGDWSTDGATVITLKGDSAAVTGGGAYAYNGDVVITGAGRYVLSGTLTDGSVIVDAKNSSKIWLLFDGVDISCSDDACLRIENADKVFLTLAADSVNSLTSGANYSQTALDDGTDGAIFAHDDLTINGSGALTVTASYKHGISANDDLIITGGAITVTAPGDGLRANEALHICAADITVTAGDEGVAVNHPEGGFYMESGTLAIETGDDGIHTESDILIAGGSLNITASDDGIHADTDFVMSGGSVTVTASDDGIHADNAFVLTGGSIDI
ncbi:MAG: carbohydrate-binding domain-containing protein, partial [Oscillospiraceae bacterium]|nr:carbohydrate-binding domain-containing protein [Oscillospiraceae bacterium]